MKKLLGMLLSVVLLLSALPALAAEVNFDETMDIELMAYFFLDVTEDDAIIQYINEKFNVRIHPFLTTIANYSDTLNMKLASGEVPEWFRVDNQAVFGQLMEDGMLLNLSELVEKYDFKNIQAQFDQPLAFPLANDGEFYRIPDGIGFLRPGVYIRQDWVDELGLEIPTTFDEFRDFLQACIDADPDGQGTSGWCSVNIDNYSTFAPSWTGYHHWGKVNGEVQYMFTDDAYRAYIQYLRDMYADGLIDKECFTLAGAQGREKMSTGRIASFTMNMNTIWWDNIQVDLTKFKEDGKLNSVVPPPAGPLGSLVGIGVPYHADSVLSADLPEEKAVRILAIFDYLLSDEGRDLTLYGFEGQHHDVVDGERVPRVETLVKEWGQTQHLLGELADFSSNDRMVKEPGLQAWFDFQSNPDNVRVNYTTYMYHPDATVIQAELTEIRNRYLIPFITGDMDLDAKWDEYVKAIENAGLPRLTEIVIEYYDKIGAEFAEVTR